MAGVPDRIQRELHEAFFLFDYDKDGRITSREVGAAIRSVGLNPTEQELKQMVNEVNNKGGTIDVSGLCQLISTRLKEMSTTVDELRDAFQVFDKQGNGQVSVHDLRHSLTTLGERLTDEELDELVREADQDGEGQAMCEDLISILLK